MIPPGEDIIYSSNFKSARNDPYNKMKPVKWVSHVLFTPDHIVYQEIDGYSKRKPLLNQCISWGEIRGIFKLGNKMAGFQVGTTSYNLVRDEKFETKEKFKERMVEFVAQFRPHLIQKKTDYINALRNNPDVKNKIIKWAQKELDSMIKKEAKRLAKLK